MLKYVTAKVVFQEVPNEVSLAVNISNCPCKCEGCHSSHLAGDVGTLLTNEVLEELLRKNQGVTCVCIMGGDNDREDVTRLLDQIKNTHKLKTCWYSGRPFKIENYKTEFSGIDWTLLDFFKAGPYIEELGGLDSPLTNQEFFELEMNESGKMSFYDRTYLFFNK